MKTYTLLSLSTKLDNYCSAKWQVVESSSNIVVFEKTADMTTKKIAMQEFDDLMRLLQSQLIKGEKMSLELVELQNEVYH